MNARFAISCSIKFFLRSEGEVLASIIGESEVSVWIEFYVSCNDV